MSLYVHIPFCIRKCRYCDFYSAPIDDVFVINNYIDALGKEWESYQNSGTWLNNPIDTIYIGGGTPSILDADMWGRLDDVLFSRIDRSQLKEWSVECNPESFTIEKARMYAESGVTRLTFGVQSLNERELSICGRAHSADRAVEVLSDGRLADMFASVGADIIYGLPGQTADTLYDTLARILSIPHIKHLSAYELTIGEGTPFGRHRGILKLPDDDTIAKQYDLIGRRCAERGMDQYEVSNYALPGFESIHNKAYWSHKPYIGLGAAAHSYVHPKRWSNISDAGKYISYQNAIDFEETLAPSDLAHEMIFLGLRNSDGIDIDNIAACTGIRIDEKILHKFIDDGLLIKSGTRYAPTSRGMLFADMMSRELVN